jgi:broad specificity phosphatase PhoE
MKRVWLIRHGQHDWIGKALVGRKPGVGLNSQGWAQARSIAEKLRDLKLAAIYSSPQQRALETAEPLAAAQGLRVRVDEALDEIDFGEWTGRAFGELAPDPRWERWNSARADGVAPGGEAMCDVQRRVLHAIEALDTEEPVAFVSHGDVIKAAMLGCMNLSLDGIHSLAVEPGALVYVEVPSGRVARVTVHEPETFVQSEAALPSAILAR